MLMSAQQTSQSSMQQSITAPSQDLHGSQNTVVVVGGRQHL